MKTVLAFDVYGTLIDTSGLASQLQGIMGSAANEFTRTWREKQLEYSFRRGLMRQYDTFAICTRDALEYTCAHFDSSLTAEDKDALLDAYRTLPAFDDVPTSLHSLHNDEFAMYAFSNGTASAVDTLLKAAGIRDCFLGIVSVDELRTFKPNPDVYHHFVKQSGAAYDRTWLVSGNPFDVIGAISAGLNGAWVKRSADAIFDPWGIEPTIEVTTLLELGERIAEHHRGS